MILFIFVAISLGIYNEAEKINLPKTTTKDAYERMQKEHYDHKD